MEEQLKRMRLEILGNVADESKDEVFKIKLEDAMIVALDALFPYDKTKDVNDLPNTKRMTNWITRCAIELYNVNPNVKSYSENGLSVTYMTSLLSDGLMSELIPKAGIPQ